MADGTSLDEILVGPKARRVEELAERAHVWDQTIYGPAESYEDVDHSESQWVWTVLKTGGMLRRRIVHHGKWA